MKLALAHCWKEWRAQRSLLLAYTSLAFACLCLGFLLVPRADWADGEFAVLAVESFVGAGVLGLVLFAAPRLVRGEFAGGRDQFGQRLPGALAPAFGGKLLFLALCTAALPLLGLVLGVLFVNGLGQPWLALFFERHTALDAGRPAFVWSNLTTFVLASLLALPWIWAVGTWLPRGRMAVGGTALLALLLGLAGSLVLLWSPGIEGGLDWQPWLWAIAPIGLCVAAASWCGRRGGGARRSAAFGGATLALGLVPPGIWYAQRAHDFHHPDLRAVFVQEASGITPDLRFVLGYGAADERWYGVPLRIDLEQGTATQLGGIGGVVSPHFLLPSEMAMHREQRYWRLGAGAQWFFDLATGERLPIGFHFDAGASCLPDGLRTEALDEARATSPFRAPGDRRAWVADGQVCIEERDGGVTREPWLLRPGNRSRLLRAVGHAVQSFGGEHTECFDLALRRVLPRSPGLSVRGLWVDEGVCYDAARDVTEARNELDDCRVLGLFDDDTLLCARRTAPRRNDYRGLFLYRPADRSLAPIVLPDERPFEQVSVWSPMDRTPAVLPRDPAGRLWLWLDRGTTRDLVALDGATHATRFLLRAVAAAPRRMALLGFPDGHSLLVHDAPGIVQLDADTAARTVLFPRR
ncbi:MAG TPA: hypothetical protein VFZ65_06980 [Planctomycetota bacterium]|nr:hypothetical protein [Planctomycetota bacterium]